MKIAPLTIYVCGISLALPAIAFGIFFNKIPNDQEAELYRQVTEQNNAEAAKQRQADQRLAQAIMMVKAKEAEWRAYVATRTPAESVQRGGINLAVNAFQLSEDTRKFRNSIQRAVNAQLRRGNVTVINGPLVPIPDPNAPANSILASFYNFPAINFPVVIFDLGTVTVQGNYKQIMDHIRAYKQMPNYLAVTDGLRLDGTSPNLTATYNLTIVGFIRAGQINGQAPEGQAPAGGGGGGIPGAPGGPPSGFRGGPGGPPMGAGGMQAGPSAAGLTR